MSLALEEQLLARLDPCAQGKNVPANPQDFAPNIERNPQRNRRSKSARKARGYTAKSGRRCSVSHRFIEQGHRNAAVGNIFPTLELRRQRGACMHALRSGALKMQMQSDRILWPARKAAAVINRHV